MDKTNQVMLYSLSGNPTPSQDQGYVDLCE